MIVKAAPGLKVPKENKAREYITEDTPVDVPGTPYYLRRLHTGDLIRHVEEAATSAPAALKGGKKE